MALLVIPQRFARWTFGQRILGLFTLVLLSYYFCFVVEWQTSRYSVEDRKRQFPDTFNRTLGFQKLLVLNLPARTDRKDATTLAAAVSDLEIEFVDGVSGGSVPEEALPPGRSSDAIKLAKGIRGSWRGHMNALQQIVHENLATAVIFEDDVDWDIRLRSQLATFAEAARFLTSSSKDGRKLEEYPVQKIPNPETEESIHNSSSVNPISKTLFSLPLSSIYHQVHSPISPYGDPSTWDILWLGHCGVGFPRPPPFSTLQPNKANVLLTNPNDDTVPLTQYLRAHPFGPLDALATSHEDHTRVYHRASGGALCTVAYAVSQRGARRLLHEFGVKGWGRIFDVEVGAWCAGVYEAEVEDEGGDNREERKENEGEGERERVCLTSQPPIFAHHHPDGGESDIGGLGGGYARGVETKYVRQSVRMNLERLVRGEKKLKDQWPG